ncbi:hypothetical protein [Spiroplasma poulsonii]|uniref:hypothetical protein n=1 Tax=Spiroplasma poulsonii TaxID=2138 RepID=UPI001F4C8E50|nr:hypothetical protein [Spiroplasma poulsonii]UNF62055.1 hypothetical protein MNU24_00900 [Spiroplasma poulsonii]
MIPFVSSPNNPRLATDTNVFTDAYQSFVQNQPRIYQLELRLLNSVIIGSVADRAIMNETMQVYDIFKAENFYIQSDRPYYWTTPIMVKGDYKTFLDYNATSDYPPIITLILCRIIKLKLWFFTIYGFKYRCWILELMLMLIVLLNESSFIYNCIYNSWWWIWSFAAKYGSSSLNYAVMG